MLVVVDLRMLAASHDGRDGSLDILQSGLGNFLYGDHTWLLPGICDPAIEACGSNEGQLKT